MRTASRWVPLLATCFLLAMPATSRAEWQFAPFLGYTFKGSTTLIDLENAAPQRRWHVGGAATLLGDGPVGVEGDFVYTPNFFDREEIAQVESSRMYAVMGNVVLTTPRRWNQYGLRPYVSGGVGVLHASNQDIRGSIPTVRVNLMGMNVGGGAVGFLTDRTGVRFDLRYFKNVRGIDLEELGEPISVGPVQLRFWTLSFGVVIKY